MTENLIYETPLLITPLSPEHLDLSKKTNILESKNNWLEDAVPLDIYVSKSKRLLGLMESILIEIESMIRIPNRKRYRDVLKMVIINLWYGHYKGKPVRYSRDRSYYSRNSRYGNLFIKYDRLIPIIDILETLGYIEQKRGIWVSEKKFGRTTRMWATFKLWRQFRTYNLRKHDFYTVARPVDVVVLRDGSHHNREMKYPLTPAISRIRDDLERYNEFLEQHNITLNIDGTVKVNTEFLVNILYKEMLKNTIKVDSVKLYTRIGNYNFTVGIIKRPLVQLFSSNIQYTDIICNQAVQPYHLLHTTMTKRILPDALVFLGFKGIDQSLEMLENYLADLSLSISMDPVKDRRKARLAEVYKLKHIGIEQLILYLRQEYIHRVFNRKSFKLGGRGYGALHQRIPKHLRPFIQIDGQPTIELDYSAYHIRMLYHQKGIDYRDDPYGVCEGPDTRDTYKAVGLIAINGDGKNPKKVYGAIRDELEERNIPLPAGKNPLVRLVSRFKEAHPLIAEYLYKDMGVHLMNMDSKIMNAILMKLMDKGILGLSVYDSVICPTPHEDFLYQVMVEEYEKMMGFKPIIG